LVSAGTERLGRTGLVYVAVQDSTGENFSVDSDFVYTPGQNNTGHRRVQGIPCPPASSDRPGAEETGAVLPTPVIGPIRTLPEGSRRGNWLVAWDPVSQAERWRAIGGGGTDGGTVTTAAELVFSTGHLFRATALSSHLRAHAADDGELLADMGSPTRATSDRPSRSWRTARSTSSCRLWSR
jgi:hypothetical protein